MRHHPKFARISHAALKSVVWGRLIKCASSTTTLNIQSETMHFILCIVANRHRIVCSEDEIAVEVTVNVDIAVFAIVFRYGK